MLESSTLAALAGPVILLLVIPGPVAFYIVACGVDQGRRGALVAVLGVQAGDLLHIVIAALGVGTLFTSSALAFGVVKYTGALYLVGLGIHTALARASQPEQLGPATQSLRSTFWHSVMINVLNPHTTLFYLAFLPAFVDPSLGATSLQFLKLGLVFLLFGLVIEGGYALLAGSIRTGLMERAHFAGSYHWIVGGVYVLIGVGLAASGMGSDVATHIV